VGVVNSILNKEVKMDLIDRIVKGAREVMVKHKYRCSWCKKKISGIAYIEPLLASLGFIYCSCKCIKKHLHYVASEKAIWDAAVPFL
jgi:hypothetical protein